MSVKMKPTSVIKTRLGIQRGGPAHAFLTEACYRYMSPFVPGGISSHLNQTVDVQVDKVIYQGPSAHYLWNGKVMGPNVPIEKEGNSVTKWISLAPKGGKYYTGKNLIYHTPGTGSQWDKRMWTSKGQEVIKEVQSYIDRGCKK